MSQARLKDKIHRAEPGQIGPVARPRDKIHRAESGQIGSVARLKGSVVRLKAVPDILVQAKLKDKIHAAES